VSVDGAYDEDREPGDHDSLRAAPFLWSDGYLRGAIRLARIRLLELDVTEIDGAQRRSYDSVMHILDGLVTELGSRAALYSEVAEALGDAVCPTCRRALEDEP